MGGIEWAGARAGLYTCACCMGGGERTGGIGWTGTRSIRVSQLTRGQYLDGEEEEEMLLC